MHSHFHRGKIAQCTLYEFCAYIKAIFYNKRGRRQRVTAVSLSVPGGRLALFLFLVLSVVFSREGHSVTSGPLEPLNWRGSLLVDGSKDRGLSPEKDKPKESLIMAQDVKALDQSEEMGNMKRKKCEVAAPLRFLEPNPEGHYLDTHLCRTHKYCNFNDAHLMTLCW